MSSTNDTGTRDKEAGDRDFLPNGKGTSQMEEGLCSDGDARTEPCQFHHHAERIQKMLVAQEQRLTDHLINIDAVCKAISAQLKTSAPAEGRRLSLKGPLDRPKKGSLLSSNGRRNSGQIAQTQNDQQRPNEAKRLSQPLKKPASEKPALKQVDAKAGKGGLLRISEESPQEAKSSTVDKTLTFSQEISEVEDCNSEDEEDNDGAGDAEGKKDTITSLDIAGARIRETISQFRAETSGLDSGDGNKFADRQSTVSRKSMKQNQIAAGKKMTYIFDKHHNQAGIVGHRRTLSSSLEGSKWSRYIREFELKAIVTSKGFEMGTAKLIVTNAIVIGIQTDWAMKNVGEKPPLAFRVFDVFFMVAFSVELLLRIFAEKMYFVKPQNENITWNGFDTLLVVSSWVEEILTSMNTTEVDMSAMQMLRVMRLIRVLRVIRVMRMMSDLRKMVQGILSSMRSLVWCILLLLLVMFLFGVAFMQIAAGELETNKVDPSRNPGLDQDGLYEFFGSLIGAIYTLYMSICGGLDWNDGAAPLISIHPLMGMLFVVYIAFTVFCVLNIVTGVFVENSTKITQQNDTNAIMDELEIRAMWSDEVCNLFKAADVDGSGELDWDEFSICLQEEKVQKFMRKLGLSLEAQNVFALFQLLDFDGNGTVDMDEFVEGCTHVHGSARSLDIVRLRHENKQLLNQMKDLENLLQPLARELPKEVSTLCKTVNCISYENDRPSCEPSGPSKGPSSPQSDHDDGETDWYDSENLLESPAANTSSTSMPSQDGKDHPHEEEDDVHQEDEKKKKASTKKKASKKPKAQPKLTKGASFSTPPGPNTLDPSQTPYSSGSAHM